MFAVYASRRHFNAPWTHSDTCALLLVGVAHAFGKVSHVQQSVRKMGKCTLKGLEGSEQGSNTSPNARIWLILDTAILCSASCCSLILIDLPRTSQGSGYILAPCLCFHFHVSLLRSSFFFAFITVFCFYDIATTRLLVPLQCREQ